MKKYRFLLFVYLLCMTIGTSAYDFSAVNADGKMICYNIKSTTDLTCEVTYSGTSIYYASYSGIVNIPMSVINENDSKTYSVTSVGEYAFYNCSSLSLVTIGNSVTSIGNYAFSGCTGLTSITIPNFVTSIGDGAFSGCKGLLSVAIGNSVSSIGDFAFQYCNSLTSMEISNSVTSIGISAFYNCTSLTSLTIGNSVINIEEQAFYKCTNLKSVEIPNSVTSIGNSAFSGCNLYSLTIGSGVLSIGDNAFSSVVKTIWMTNTPPTGYEKVKSNVHYVSNDLYTKFTNTRIYQNLSSLFTVGGIKYAIVSPSLRTCDVIDCAYDSTSVDVNIGETVVYKNVTLNVLNINDYSCYGNTYIEKANISNDGYVGAEAFYKCTGLQTLNISNYDYLGYNAFYGTTALDSAVIKNKGYIEVSAFEDSDVKYLKILNEDNIRDGAFYNCKSLRTLSVANNGNIGSSVFCNTTSLDSAYIANKGYVGASAFENSGVKVAMVQNKGGIYDSAFKNCKKLVDVSLSDSITTLGNSVFYSCTSLPKVVIPNNITAMGENIFQDCKALTSVKIGTGIPEIKTYAFSWCSSLPEIEIPQNVKSIGNYTFSGCTSLTDVIFADRKTALTLGSNGADAMFKDCPLDSVYIGGKLKYNTAESYGYSPFYRNTSLRTVVITNEEETVYDNEFYGCTGLKSVSIGNGTTSIGNWAFSNCQNLEYFAFGQKMATIGKESFSDCIGVTKIISHAVVPPVCGEQALDDINKWECELIVPKGHGQDYTQAEQWKEFFFISESGEEEPVYVTSVTVDESEYLCILGQTGQATATVKPDDATNKTVVWSSSDEDKLTIDVNTGEFTGLAVGEVTITATATDGSGVFGQAIVKICGNVMIVDKNDNVNYQVADEENALTIIDEDVKKITIAEDVYNVKSITYSRTFNGDNVNKWVDWYVPFDVNVEDMQGLYEVAQIQATYLDEYNNTIIAFMKIDNGIVKANTPYMVKSLSSGDVVLTVKDASLHKTNNEAFAIQSATDNFIFGGVYEQQTKPESEIWYMVNNDGDFQKMENNSKINPFRIYMNITPRSDSPYSRTATKKEVIKVMVINEDTPSGIKEIGLNAADKASPISSPEGKYLYNLQGQRVKSLELRAESGGARSIVIKNGKKYLMK